MFSHIVPEQNTAGGLIDSEFIYQNSPCGYLSFYPDGTIIKINQTLLSWLDAESDTLTGNANFSSLLTTGGRFYFELVVLPLLQMQGFANEINFDIKSKAGSFPSLFNASAVTTKDGTILAFNAIILNITDRKKYELLLVKARQNAEEDKKRFEFLLNTIPHVVWTASPSGNIDFVNDRFFQTFGDTTRALRFNSFLHLIHPAQQKQTWAIWKKSLETQTKFEAEVRLRVTSEEYEWFLINAAAYKDSEGNVTNWFGSCTNINEQKEHERITVEKLNESLSEAGELIKKNSQTLREIAFNQSHLVRHPLTNILGITDIMCELKMDNDLSKLVAMLQTSAKQLDDVIKEIVFKTSGE